MRAYTWDNPTFAETQNEEAFEQAHRIIEKMLTREIMKNDSRFRGARKHVSEIGEA